MIQLWFQIEYRPYQMAMQLVFSLSLVVILSWIVSIDFLVCLD